MLSGSYEHMLPRCMTFFRATVAAKLVYCSPAWSGFCSDADIGLNRLDAFLKRCKRYGYTVQMTFPIYLNYSRTLTINCFLVFHSHVLKLLLPTQTQHSYNLRDRRHNFVLIEKNSQINHRHFIIMQKIV